MKRAAFLFLLFASCNRTTNAITPEGTVLVEWDHTKSTRPAFAGGKVGAKTAKDFTVTVTPDAAPPFVLSAHVETAEIDYPEGTSNVHQLAPVVIKVTVKSNTGWDLSGNCEDGPNYQMPGVGPDGGLVTPLGMIQGCMIKYIREAGTLFTSSWRLGVTLEAKGNGTMTAFPDKNVKIE